MNPPTAAQRSLLLRPVFWVPVGLLLLAFLLRFLWLGMKPPHFDEGVNGWWVDQMFKSGRYAYDPENYHGPFHFYVLFLMQALFGREVVAFRLPVVLVNFATVWLILGFRRWLGRPVCWLAALAAAVSAGMVFNSRYAIHEAWLLLGLVLLFWGIAELWTAGSRRGLFAIVGAATLMILTKETYLIHFIALGLAFPTLWGLEKISPSRVHRAWAQPVRARWEWFDLSSALSVALLAIFFFYSGGGTDMTLLSGLVTTFFKWKTTGFGDAVNDATHVKEWYYWGQILIRHEWPAVLGLLYSIRALFPGMNRLSRLMAIYGCGTLVAYSLIPYKTPWCVLALIWPFFFLFGEAMVALARLSRGLAGGLAGVVLAVALYDSVLLNFGHPAEPEKEVFIGAVLMDQLGWNKVVPEREGQTAAEALEERIARNRIISEDARYIYVQTKNDFWRLVEPMKEALRLDPAFRHQPVRVFLDSYHPLPWVFGDFSEVFYHQNGPTEEADAAVIVVDEEWLDEVKSRLTRPYFTTSFQLRDGMPNGVLFFDAERFSPVFPRQQPDFVPGREGDL